jgi:hypothetical protein
MPLRFVLDEDTRDTSLWQAICDHNSTHPDKIDVIRVGDGAAPPTGTLDPALVEWSVQSQRIIVSKDRNTLIAAHTDAVSAGTTTPGLFILRNQLGIPTVVDCTSDEFASSTQFLPME